MKAHEIWRSTFKRSCWLALAMGFVFFANDWAGYDPHEPDIFFPRPLSEVWWELPVAVAVSFAAVQLTSLYDWAKTRTWPYWVAYAVVLIAVVFFGAWVVLQIVP